MISKGEVENIEGSKAQKYERNKCQERKVKGRQYASS